MSFSQGAIILGRFKVVSKLPAWGELHRYTAQDEVTGDTVMLHTLAPEVHIRKGAFERFQQATRRLPEHPSLSRPLASGEHNGAPVAGYPLAAQWSASAPMPAEQVMALAQWLGAGIAAAPETTAGILRPEALVVRPDGVPMIQPTGVQEKASQIVPEPCIPPTSDSALDGALYGLGVLLFEAATGRPPFSAKTRSDLQRQQQQPPSVRDSRPDLPEELDQLLQGLLSPDPATRRRTLVAPPDTPPLLAYQPRSDASPASSTGGTTASSTPALTTPKLRTASPRAPLADWVVLADLDGIPVTLQRRLAALSGISEAALKSAADQGLPIPVGGARTEQEAQRIAEQYRVASVPLTVAPSKERSQLLLLGGGGAAALGLLGGGLGALVLMLLGMSSFLLVLTAVIGSVLFLAGLVAAGLAVWRSGVPASLKAAHRLTGQTEDTASPLVARMQEARRVILTSELPEPAQVDLLTAVDDLQDVLPDLDSDAEHDQVSSAIENIIQAGSTSQNKGGDASRLAAEASRRAHAARIAAKEIR